MKMEWEYYEKEKAAEVERSRQTAITVRVFLVVFVLVILVGFLISIIGWSLGWFGVTRVTQEEKEWFDAAQFEKKQVEVNNIVGSTNTKLAELLLAELMSGSQPRESRGRAWSDSNRLPDHSRRLRGARHSHPRLNHRVRPRQVR